MNTSFPVLSDLIKPADVIVHRLTWYPGIIFFCRSYFSLDKTYKLCYYTVVYIAYLRIYKFFYIKENNYVSTKTSDGLELMEHFR